MTFAGQQLKEIGRYAFSSTNLTEVQIPASVQTIRKEAFSWCENLKKVTFAAGSQLRVLGDKVFNGCNKFILILPEGLTSIGERWFIGSVIKQVCIPASVQSIERDAFS